MTPDPTSPNPRPHIDSSNFFNQLGKDYTAMIERVVPRYREMLGVLLEYAQIHAPKPQRILELGTGTGNVSVLLEQQYPEAELTLVDFAQEQLDECEQRLRHPEHHRLLRADFQELEFASDSFDLVISSIALHHLPDPAKATLYTHINDWLTDEGLFTFLDQCAGRTPELYEHHMRHWKQWAMEHDVPESEWQTWMDHQDESDYHAPVEDHFRWLDEAGFAWQDVIWRNWLWTIVQSGVGEGE
jgi:tRNA (cmo5U34)-methyltransferase